MPRLGTERFRPAQAHDHEHGRIGRSEAAKQLLSRDECDLEEIGTDEKGDIVPVDGDDVHLRSIELEGPSPHRLDLADDRITAPQDDQIGVLRKARSRRQEGCHQYSHPDGEASSRLAW